MTAEMNRALVKQVLLMLLQLSQDCSDDCEGIDDDGVCGCPVNGADLTENVIDHIRSLTE